MKNLQIHCNGPKSVAELTYHARIPTPLTYFPADGWMDHPLHKSGLTSRRTRERERELLHARDDV